MTKLSWIVVVVLVLALGALSVLYGQAVARQASPAPSGVRMAQAPGGGGGWSQMSEAERAKMREQMTERMIDEAGLNSKEKAAAKKSMKAKDKARQSLADELTKLRRTANKSKPTNAELTKALSSYRAAMTRYRSRAAAGDQALTKQLSLRSQVRCTSLGILDNGLGGMGAMGRMGGGMGRPGGMRGGPPRG